MINYNIMSFLIAILVVIILSLSVSYIFQKRFEYILPATMAAISLILYAFSFIGERSLGISLILCASIISVAFSIYKIVNKHGRISSLFNSAGLVGFLLISLVICIIIRGFVFSTWDEFSHWGLVLKNLFSSNNFGNLSDSTTLFKWYPQGISLFLNFVTHFSKSFSESSALGGLLAISYAQLIIIFTEIKRNDWKNILIITGIILVTPLVFFNSFYSTVYVDAVIALVFANILFFNYSYPKKDIFYAIYMSLQFYLLVNTKQIGVALALIAFAAIIISFIYSTDKLRPITTFIVNKNRELVYILIPIISGVLTYLSWKFYIKSHHIVDNFSVSIYSNFLNLFKPNFPHYYELTVINFVHNFFDIKQYGIISLSPFLWSIIMALIIYCVYRLSGPHKKKNFSFQLSIILGLYLYSGMILLLYLIAFDEYESTALASVDRYLGSYFLGLLMVTIFILVNYFIKSKEKFLPTTIKLSFILFILLCIIPINSLVDNTILKQSSASSRYAIRAPYENVKQYIDFLNPKKDRVYVVSQHSSGFDYYVLVYNFTPIQTQPWARDWSLGKPYSTEDQWTYDISEIKWSKILENFTYVYLYNIDDRFINDYGKLFDNISDIKSRNIYSVHKTNAGVILKIANLK